MNCLWCHNPESKSHKRELLYTAGRCVNCGACVSRCPNACHSARENLHTLDRLNCNSCGNCVEVGCPALEFAGKEWDAADVIAEVEKDRLFYEESGGGMTLSGGEPLFQPEFSAELLRRAWTEGFHTCIETSGFGRPEDLKSFFPFVDLFLFDYKETDPVLHFEYTGIDNKIILENLNLLDRLNGKIILRCPVVPGKNDREDHFAGIAETVNKLKNIFEIQLEPYHPFGEGKCERLGKSYPLAGLASPHEETVSRWIKAIQEKTKIPVRQA